MAPIGLNLNVASRVILHFANPHVNGQILQVDNYVEIEVCMYVCVCVNKCSLLDQTLFRLF